MADVVWGVLAVTGLVSAAGVFAEWMFDPVGGWACRVLAVGMFVLFGWAAVVMVLETVRAVEALG